MKNILVIGDDSYIGCKIYDWLKKYPAYFNVDIISSRDNKWRDADFSKYAVVVNTAGLAHINNITEDMKPLFYAVNRDLPIEIAKECKTGGVSHFIHFSSMNVYGDYCDDLHSRDNENPTSFYGDSKYQGDLGISELEDDKFKVSYLRPPFVYGKGCRGNYNSVSKIAKKTPLFPSYRNKKSMIYIDNLCEFVRLAILNEWSGVLTPQNKELVSTSALVRAIAKVNGKNVYSISIFNPLIKLAVKKSRTVRRAFGNDDYDLSLSDYANFDYSIVDFEDSIKRTEL